jgi:hypothetical protein
MSPEETVHYTLFRLSIDVCLHLSGSAMFDGDSPLVDLVFNKIILHLDIFSALQAAGSAICLEQHCAHVVLVKEQCLHVETLFLHEVVHPEDVVQ